MFDLQSLGVAGLLAAFYAARQWFSTIWQQVASVLVVHATCDNHLLRRAVEDFCLRDMPASKLGRRTYDAILRPGSDMSEVSPLIVVESIGPETRLFWFGWVPIWIARGGGNSTGGPGLTPQKDTNQLQLTYFRGTVDIRKFLDKAVEARYGLVRRGVKRHRIARFSGYGRQAGMGSSNTMVGGQQSKADYNNGWWSAMPSLAQQEASTPVYTKTLADLWLCPDAQRVVADFDYWLKSRKWFDDRGIMWRRSYGLYGDPGTGKSSLVKHLAQHYDLPLFVFELGTMCDRELFEFYEYVMVDLPCVVLFEDIDGVFHGREPARPDLEVTFQAWINVLDGVKSAPGIATFITTNKPECFDPAVATWCGETGVLRCTRPGRMDISARMLPLARDGRHQLARRYLRGLTDEAILDFVDKHADSSAAVFQDACVALAVSGHFKGTVNAAELVHVRT